MMSADGSKQVLDYPFHAPTSLEPPEEWARLRQGCPVVVCNLAAANRDEKAFAHADEMDLLPNAHLAFGVGPHSCLGQALARTELQTALSVLLRRLPTLVFDIPAKAPPRREGLIVEGLEKVPVRW
jgi:cytochrome P450